MPNEQLAGGMMWLSFAMITVASWGCYGVLLHTGQVGMADPENGRYKAFLFVGVAYLVTAVIGSLIVLKIGGAEWTFPAKGTWWSLIAGCAGALGAFGILLAFGAKGTPPVVMTIVFAGAPIVNAIVSMVIHPPASGLAALNWQFIVGILAAAGGASLVTLYRPH
ncbi:MAG: hypothetical protein CME19_24555 [Gemmatimonadetes bacterium]|nr:hypothetical protein [Gemmatimonadota bacterium]|tara:strand:- start:731 stop:1225 length:495 start_codon:yes stop_codon:yes gene_type:complete